MTKISGKFYPLQNEEWLKAWSELKPAEIQVLYYLRTLDPFGEKEIELGVSALAHKLGLAKSTVSKALKALDEKGWINLELIKVKVKLHSRCFLQETSFPTENTVSSDEPQFPTGNPSFPQETPVSPSEQPQAETQTQQEVDNSKTIQTYSDFKKTLSEDERERFFYFVRQEVKNFREPIKDLEAWLASKNAAGQNRWEVYYRIYQSSRPNKDQNKDSPCLENSDGSKTQKRPSLREEIEQRRQEVLAYYASLKENSQQAEATAHA